MSKSIWQNGIKVGLIGGVSAVLLALIGMVEAFSQRDIISNVISMGHTLLLLVAVFMGYLAAKRTTRTEPLWVLANSLISGLVVGGYWPFSSSWGVWLTSVKSSSMRCLPFMNYSLLNKGHRLAFSCFWVLEP